MLFRVLADATGDLSVTGPRTRAMFKTKTGIARMITIELKPGWSAQLLGVPANLLTDRIVLLHDIWGSAGTDLCRQLLEARSVHEVIDRISHAVRNATLSADWGRIASDAGYYDQAHLISDFRELVGLTPRAFAKSQILAG